MVTQSLNVDLTSRSMPRNSRFWDRVWRSGIVAALIAVGTWGAFHVRTMYENRVPILLPQDIPPRVSALGRLTPNGEVIAVAPPGTNSSMSGACVQELRVAVGDHVDAGQIVAILDTYHSRSATVLERTASVEVAKARLNQIRTGPKPAELRRQEAVIARCEAELLSATEDLERANRLVASKAISTEDVTMRRLKLRQASANASQAAAELESLKDIRPVDVCAAEAEVQQAEAALSVAEADLKSAEVRSPVAGQVLSIRSRPGERVSDRGIIDVGNTDEMHVVAEVYEEDIARVCTGQKARIRIPTLGTDLSGTVISKDLIVSRKVIFDNDPVADIDARVVEVRLRLAAEDSVKVAALSNSRVEVVIESPRIAK